MQIHNLIQGSPEWHEFRLRHFGASEAAAMLGLSRNVKRTELLHMKHTGIAREYSDWMQKNVLDKGHEVEAIARTIVEKMIGDDLYPVTCSDGKLSASCDGLTMSYTIAFEHKQWNAECAEMVRNGILPDEHAPQCHQILLVTGAAKLIFVISDGTEDRRVSMEVLPDQEWFARIRAGWEQFQKDLDAYVPQVIAEKPKAEVTIDLPTLFVHAKGEITKHNMDAFGVALTARLVEVRAIALVTDQDFSNAKEAAKKFRNTAKDIALSKEQMLAQTETIGDAARKMDAWAKDLNATALQLEKDVEREDLAKKSAMVLEGKTAYAEHLAALESEIVPIRLFLTAPDFAAAIKGKRNYASMHDAIQTMLSTAKIGADAAAKDVRDKLAWMNEYWFNAGGNYQFLFADLSQIIVKPLDDFKLLVNSRIESHKRAEADKPEAERQRIRDEESQRAQAAFAESNAKTVQEKEYAHALADRLEKFSGTGVAVKSLHTGTALPNEIAKFAAMADDFERQARALVQQEQHMNAIDQHQIGLYNKFNVTRADGKDAPGEKHHGDAYFVLNLTTDKNAVPALAAYADACADEYPKLADDLRGIVAGKVLEMSEFITVPQITLPNGTVVPSFGVGKYLASRGPMGTPVSIATAKPWVEISYHDALDATDCNAIDLLKETQALAIAWDISQQDINWTGGKVGEGKIYQGLHKGTVDEAAPGNYESGQIDARRWHQLSNGERIHDFAGNAFSWIFDDVQGDEKGLTGKIAADSISLTTAPFPSQEKGMGWRPDGARDWSGRALIRGGYWYSESNAGVFYLYRVWPGNEYDIVGFRCTKGL